MLSQIKKFPKQILKCSNCDRGIVDVIVAQESKTIKYRLRAECPFCGDKSYVKEFNGLVKICPSPYVELIDSCEVEDYTLFKTKKIEEKNHE